MLKKILPTNLFSSEGKSKQKRIQIWEQQSQRQPKSKEDNEIIQNSQTKTLSNLKKTQSIQKKDQISKISSQYQTVKDFKDKQSKQLNENEIKLNQNNPDFNDDDLNDFHKLLLLQQLQELNISQILPLKQMQKQVLENVNSKRENQKFSQPNENYQNYQKNSKQKPEFLKLIKQINRQEKQEQRNRLFQNLNQNQVKSLILGSYIDKLLSDYSLKILKEMPQKFPGSTRIPRDQKQFLLMFLQQVVQQVELGAERFSPKKYKFKIEENVKETIEFSKKIQIHFTLAKINLIYKLTEAYKNRDYIHAEAKKILFRNLIKITKQHQQYKQKLRMKFQKAEKQVRNEPSLKQSDTPQKNMYTRSWAAQSQDYQFVELKGQKKKNSYQSEANKEDLKSLHGRLGKFCQEEDAKSIGLNSQNNCVFGYRSDFEYPAIDIKQKQMNINMQKNFKRIYQNECGLNKIVMKSKQKEKQWFPNEQYKSGQFSRSLQKWKQRQRQNIRNNYHPFERKEQSTQTENRKTLKISKQTQFNFQPSTSNIVKQIVNVLYTETPQGQNPIPHLDKKQEKVQKFWDSYLPDNLSSDEEDKGPVIKSNSKDSLSISFTTEGKNNRQEGHSIRGQIQNSQRQNSIMNSTGQIDPTKTNKSQAQIKFVSIEEKEKQRGFNDDSDNDDSDDSDASDASDDSSDQRETYNSQNKQLVDLTRIIDAKIKSKDVTNNCILQKQEEESQKQWSSQSSHKHEKITSIQVQPILGQPVITNPESITKNKNKCLQPYQNEVHLIKKDIKQQKRNQIGNSETKVTIKNIPPLPPSNSNPATNLQPYRKFSQFLKGKLLPKTCQQFQSYFITYANSKPAFHVEKRRKLLDFVFEVCQEIQKTRKSGGVGVGGVLESDKNTKLGIEMCKLINEPKAKYLKDISLKYYKDYFPVDQKREMFSDVKQIIRLVRLHG